MKKLNNKQQLTMKLMVNNKPVVVVHFGIGIIAIDTNYSLRECGKLFWTHVLINDQSTTLDINETGESLVFLDFKTGEVTYGSSYDPDTKSQWFWDYVMMYRPDFLKKHLKVETPEQAYERAMKIL